MIERVRAFLVVVEEGSVNRAALRLRITQPALSRQMKTLEDEIGGRLLDREARGVTPTDLGHALVSGMRPILESYDAALSALRRRERGPRSVLRVGYLISAASSVLRPALRRLRTQHPDLRFRLFDMSPKEQIAALQAGELDVALIGQEGSVAARAFYSRKLCSLGVCAALSDDDPLAGRPRIALEELRRHRFVGVDEDQMPGRNAWIRGLCRQAGFVPRFLGSPDGITHVLGQVAAESATTLLPGYFLTFEHPGVAFVPVSDPKAVWDFIILWQRGKTPAATRLLVDALAEAARAVAGMPNRRPRANRRT
ncbi:MAG: LysR family transcriptional regulator [Verrucomicrobiales bacterium]|nr:LysR family transcriptional regulator [Verrucomicrobiales bacterium]